MCVCVGVCVYGLGWQCWHFSLRWTSGMLARKSGGARRVCLGYAWDGTSGRRQQQQQQWVVVVWCWLSKG